jgi:peptide/nickel transport system substrate-binding protein
LAADWQVDKTSKHLTFNLRKGVEFHDGSKFNAAAGKWSLDRVRSHPKSYLASDLKEIDSVDVLNDYAIAINLKYPRPASFTRCPPPGSGRGSSPRPSRKNTGMTS